MVFSLEQFYVNEPDARMPRLPNVALFQACLKKRKEYPLPYPEKYAFSRYIGENLVFSTWLNPLCFQKSLLHAAEKISMLASTVIEIKDSSVLVADEIFLKAPIVKIYDNPSLAIRTSVIAKKRLTIMADEIAVNGSDILPVPDCSIRANEMNLFNVTPNTQWLVDLLEPSIPK